MKGQYLYATGRLRSLENKLLSTGDIERLIDAKDAPGTFKVFNDLVVADNLADIESEQDYNNVLNQELLNVKTLLNQISPNQNVLQVLFLNYDFHNIKLLFKAKYLEKDFGEYETQLGTLNIEELKKQILKGEKNSLPVWVAEIIKEADKLFEKEKSGFIIDSYLDYKYFEEIKKLAYVVADKFLNDLVSQWIDASNVKLLLRAKRADVELSKVKDYFADGGKLSRLDIIKIYSKDIKDIAGFLSKHFQDQEIKSTLEEIANGGELWKLEKAFDNYEISYIKSAKYVAYGSEVLIAYYLSIKNAVKNIRIIFTGKLNKLSSGEIKERLRDLYYSHIKYKV